jgi:zinc and cadmium transporter
MAILAYIIIATFIISLISFAGALVLFLKEKILDKILLLLVSFSAGALMGGAFLHLMPEVITEIGTNEKSLSMIFWFLITGFCTFFVLEQFIKWHHHHSTKHPDIMPFSYLILVSDGLHNFIDGLVIAGSFIASPAIGLATSFAVILHEIPQEIGDFAVLIYGGMKKTRALFLNFLSATIAMAGGIVGFFVFKGLGENVMLLLPFTAGGFVYVAASDLIPRIKEEENSKKSFIHFMVFLTGIAIMVLMKILVKE